MHVECIHMPVFILYLVDLKALPGEVVAHHEFGSLEGRQVSLDALEGVVCVQEDGIHLEKT